MKNIIAVYPGSFDPVTMGHIDLIQRGAGIFSRLIVGVGDNPKKQQLFTMEERVGFIEQATSGLDNVSVMPFTTLLVEFAELHNAHVILKGLRAMSDFDYELQMSLINRRMNDKLETVFMMPSEEYSFVSSSLIKEIASFNGNLGSMVPNYVEDALKLKLGLGR